MGGNTSRMPPRTAISPRCSTRSVRAYPMSTRCAMTSSKSAAWPLRRATGSRSPRPLTIGCSRLRTGVTSTLRAPDRTLPASGWASLRSTASRRPDVSERGDSRSCGRVSQAGRQATVPSGSSDSSPLVRTSASRAVAVTARTKRGWSGRGIARDRGGQEGAERRGRDQVGISVALAQGALQLGIRGDNAEQSSEAHGVLGVRLGRSGSTKGPRWRADRHPDPHAGYPQFTFRCPRPGHRHSGNGGPGPGYRGLRLAGPAPPVPRADSDYPCTKDYAMGL